MPQGSQTPETQRLLPYNVVSVDSDTEGGDGAVQLVARMREPFSAAAAIFSVVGGGPDLNWRGKRELEGDIP